MVKGDSSIKASKYVSSSPATNLGHQLRGKILLSFRLVYFKFWWWNIDYVDCMIIYSMIMFRWTKIMLVNIQLCSIIRKCDNISNYSWIRT